MNARVKAPVISPAQHQKNLTKLLEQNAHRHQLFDVFRDFVEMSALAISNRVDLANQARREARYMDIIKAYNKEEAARFPKMLGELVCALECGPDDVLGQVFHALELSNAARGQFFTPYSVCQVMARMQVGDTPDLRQRIEERGFITVSEPACGAGAMAIAIAETMTDRRVNYQQHLHVTAVDIDPRAVHMAYLQFSLLGIPAVVIRGNALLLEELEHWYTPMHVTGLWDYKLRRGYALGSALDQTEPAPAPALPEPPTPALSLPVPTHSQGAQFALF